MDREFQELKHRYNLTQSVEDSIRLFSMGQRLGFRFIDYWQHQIPWTVVRNNFWQINPLFLSQQECHEYAVFLNETTNWHVDFVKKKELFAHAIGDWHPTYPQGKVSVYAGAIGVPYDFPQRGWPWEGAAMRLAFWGVDNTGREIDIGPNTGDYFRGVEEEDPEKMLDRYEEIVRTLPSAVTPGNLKPYGFYSA